MYGVGSLMQLTNLYSTLHHSAFTTGEENSRSYECVVSGEGPFRSWVANDGVLSVFECSKVERSHGHDTTSRLESNGSSVAADMRRWICDLRAASDSGESDCESSASRLTSH